MKTGMKVMAVLGIAALAATAQADVEKQDLANRLWKAMCNSPDTKDKSIEFGRTGVWCTPLIETRAKSAVQYAKTNNIPMESVLEAAKWQIKASCAVLEANETKRSIELATTQCGWMLALLLTVGDPSSLPFIEEMCFGISNQWVRNDFINAYISFANTNAVPFLRRVMTESRYMRSDFSSALGYFLQMLKTTPDINGETFTFLYELADQSGNGYYARQVDEVLCEMLPEYSNSVQRLMMVTRHISNVVTISSPSFVQRQKYFRNTKEEIEKIPENERKDLRAKGELLDPDRKREP